MPGTFTPPPTESPGAQVPSAGWDQIVTDLNLLRSAPVCRLYWASGTAAPAAGNPTANDADIINGVASPSLVVWTAITDNWAMLNPSSRSDVLIPAGWGGHYDINATVTWTAIQTPGTARTDILVNGTSVDPDIRGSSNSLYPLTTHCSTTYSIVAGGKIQVGVIQKSAVSSNFASASLSVRWRAS